MQQQHSIPGTLQDTPAAPGDSIPVVPLRHPLRLASAVVLILVALSAAWDVAVNQRYHWDVVVSYLFAPQIIAGDCSKWRPCVAWSFAPGRLPGPG